MNKTSAANRQAADDCRIVYSAEVADEITQRAARGRRRDPRRPTPTTYTDDNVCECGVD
ncbi:hypothetical protein ACFZAV_25410 [Streptomyces sp. NPDC008343]|uniref:hypothetical protein n=1 Tax=Streptomyces sp. NPDC008343 TaxID=3364828 RepID=UPI0036E5153E